MWCASLKVITTPAACSVLYQNSKHPNSQATLTQFKCSRPLRSMGNCSAEQTAESWRDEYGCTFEAASAGLVEQHATRWHLEPWQWRPCMILPRSPRRVLWVQFFQNDLISLRVFTCMPFPSLITSATSSPFRTLLMCHPLQDPFPSPSSSWTRYLTSVKNHIEL